MIRIMAGLLIAVAGLAAQPYDLLLKGGHVIDPKNNVNRVMDVAIAAGKIARVGANIPAADAKTKIDASGLYVSPGLIDMHAHVYAGTGERAIAGDQSVYPDGFSFRTGVTTMVDAGSSGSRTFADFKDRVIDRARTRVLAFLNISGAGMGKGENEPADINAEEAVKTAKANPELIVGFKVAHFSAGGWLDVENAVKAGEASSMPVMVDFGRVTEERNLRALLLDKLRPGDIYTHCYSGHRDELLANGELNPVMEAARKRGIIFDLGHGAGSFYWYVAVPAFKRKFHPDSISTDLHTGSMNSGMKDLPETMSKVLNLGVPLEEVVRESTWNPAREIKHMELGNLDAGADADVTVFKVETGQFGFIDSAGAQMDGNRRIAPELTIRKGVVVWDRNGLAAIPWTQFPYDKKSWTK